MYTSVFTTEVPLHVRNISSFKDQISRARAHIFKMPGKGRNSIRGGELCAGEKQIDFGSTQILQSRNCFTIQGL